MNNPFLNNAEQTSSATNGLTDAELRASAVPVTNSGTQLVSGNVNVFGSFSTSIAASATVLALQQANTPWLTMTPGGSSYVQIIGSLSASIASSAVVIALQPASLPWLTNTPGGSSFVQIIGSLNTSIASSAVVLALQPANTIWQTNTPGASSSVQVIGTVPVSLSGTQLVSGNVNVVNTARSLTGSGAVISYQGGTWVVTDTSTGFVQSLQAGIWTVQPGNTPNTVPWITNTPGGSSQVVIIGTVPVSFSSPTVNQGSTVSTVPWLVNTPGSSGYVQLIGTVPATQSGTWTVQQGSTPSTTPWLTVTPGASSSIQVIGNPAVAQSGTWTVQPGNTSNTAPWLTQTPGGSSVVVIQGTPATTLSGSANQVGIAAGVGTGWNPFACTSLVALTVVSSGACKLGSYGLMNLNSIPAYIQCFDAAQGTSVTVGTTTPTMIIPLPANSAPTNGVMANIEITCGYNFINGLKVAVTTSATGSGLVGTGLIGTMGYR